MNLNFFNQKIKNKWPIWNGTELKFIKNCLKNSEWSRGYEIELFEKKFSEFCGINNTLLVNSGTNALILALKSLNINPGDEIIVPGLNWPSSAIAVMECGAKAVIVDIEQKSHAISLNSIKKNISNKTKAIIVVHLFNSIADIESLLQLKVSQNLKIIEDASQALGTEWNHKLIGTFGDIGIFSFQQKKFLTCGEGGCLITNNNDYYLNAFSLRDHGFDIKNKNIKRYGNHYRISSINAAILIAQLNRLPKILRKENNAAVFLIDQLKEIPEFESIRSRKGINFRTHYSFCIRLKNQKLIKNKLIIINELNKKTNIPFSSLYPPLDNFELFKPYYEKRYQDLWEFKELKNCYKAYKDSIRFPHYYLLSSKKNLRKLILVLKQLSMKFS